MDRRMTRLSAAAAVGFALAAPGLTLAIAPARAEQPFARTLGEETKPRITIIAMMDEMRARPIEPGGASATTAEDLMKVAPNVGAIAQLSSEQVDKPDTQSLNDALWLNLATRVNDLQASPYVDGIVVSQGADTLEETAYFLDLVIKGNKPVIVVPTMQSKIGPSDLYDAVASAASPGARGRGVLVVSEHVVRPARDIVRTTAGPMKFDSRAVAGSVDGAVTWSSEPTSKSKPAFTVTGQSRLPRVDIIDTNANADALTVRMALTRGARGIILAGDGNTPASLIAALETAANNGVVVVRSPPISDRAAPREDGAIDDPAGFVAGGDIDPRKAKVLLQLALTKTQDAKRIQKMFDQS